MAEHVENDENRARIDNLEHVCTNRARMKLLPIPLDDEDDTVWVSIGGVRIMQKTRKDYEMLKGRGIPVEIVAKPQEGKNGHTEQKRAQKSVAANSSSTRTHSQSDDVDSTVDLPAVTSRASSIRAKRITAGHGTHAHVTRRIGKTSRKTSPPQTSRASLRSNRKSAGAGGYAFTEQDQAKGGKTRWKGMNAKSRAAAARKAVQARWAKYKKHVK